MQLLEKKEKNPWLVSDFQTMIQSIGGLVTVHDANNHYLAVTQSVAKFCGFTSPEQMIGLRNHDVKAGAALRGHEYDLQNQDVLISKKSRKYFGINGPYSCGGYYIFFYEKMNMTVQNQNCILTYTSDVTNENYAHKITELMKGDRRFKHSNHHNYLVDNFQELHALSGRESEVLFYTLRGKSAKECARLLKTSTKTAEFHLVNLKRKFNVYNRSQLIEKALDLGYLYCIPSSFIQS